MRHRPRLNPLTSTRGMRERLSPVSDRVEQLDPIGVIDINYPYPHFFGDITAIDAGKTGTAKIGVLSGPERISYAEDNALKVRREISFSTTNYALSGLAVDTYPIINYLRDTQNMTTNWTTVGLSKPSTPDAIGPDGLTSAITLTSTGTPASITQSRGAIGTGTKRFSVWLRRVSGAGTVQICCNTSSYTTVTVTSQWQRFEATTTSQVIAEIRITSSPYQQQVIEAYAPVVTRQVGYFGNAPEIIHATASDLTYNGSSFVLGENSPTSEGVFVFEACLARRYDAARTFNPFIQFAKFGSGDESLYCSATFGSTQNTYLSFASDGFDEASDFTTDASKVSVVRIAMSWDANGAVASYNGNSAIALSINLSGVTEPGIYVYGSGCAIRYAAYYPKPVDSWTLEQLSTVKT